MIARRFVSSSYIPPLRLAQYEAFDVIHFAMIAGDVQDSHIMEGCNNASQHYGPVCRNRAKAFIGLSEWEVAEAHRLAALDTAKPLGRAYCERIAANVAANGQRDTLGHSSIQPWSAGDLFPAVIARVERYNDPVGDIEYCLTGCAATVSYELRIGAFCDEYATREDAEMVARWACKDGRIVPGIYEHLLHRAPRMSAGPREAHNG